MRADRQRCFADIDREIAYASIAKFAARFGISDDPDSQLVSLKDVITKTELRADWRNNWHDERGAVCSFAFYLRYLGHLAFGVDDVHFIVRHFCSSERSRREGVLEMRTMLRILPALRLEALLCKAPEGVVAVAAFAQKVKAKRTKNPIHAVLRRNGVDLNGRRVAVCDLEDPEIAGVVAAEFGLKNDAYLVQRVVRARKDLLKQHDSHLRKNHGFSLRDVERVPEGGWLIDTIL